VKINLQQTPALKAVFIIAVTYGLISLFDLSQLFKLQIGLCGTLIFLLSRFFRFITFSYLLALFSFAMLLNFALNFEQFPRPKKTIPPIKATFEGIVVEHKKTNKKVERIIAKGNLKLRDLQRLDNVKVMINIFSDSSQKLSFNYGDKIYSNLKVKLENPAIELGEFDINRYLKSQNCQYIAWSKPNDIALVGFESKPLSIFKQTANSISNQIEKIFNKDSQALAKAMLLGDKSQLDKGVRQKFSLTGTAHILAISGLHIGLLSGLVFITLGFISNRLIKLIFASIIIISFVLVTGAHPSAIRASIMIIMLTSFYLLSRQVSGLNLLAFVALIMVVYQPTIIMDLGFQLSFLSLFGIFLFSGNFWENEEDNRDIKNSLISKSLLLTLSASIFISPIIAFHFGFYSFISPLANLLVLPLMTLFFYFSFFATIVSYIAEPIASLYANSASLLLNLSENILDIMLNYDAFYVKDGGAIFISIFAALVIIYFITAKNFRLLLFRISVALCVILVFKLHFNSTFQQIENNKLVIIPREQFVFIELDSKQHGRYFIIIDRRLGQYPKNDFFVNNYIANAEEKSILLISGNAGINVSDYVNKNRDLIVLEMDFEMVKRLQRTLNQKEALFRKVENYVQEL